MNKFIFEFEKETKKYDIEVISSEFLFDEDMFSYSTLKVELKEFSQDIYTNFKDAKTRKIMIDEIIYDILSYNFSDNIISMLVERNNISKNDINIVDELLSKESHHLPSQSKRVAFDEESDFSEKESEIINPDSISAYEGSQTPLDDLNKLMGLYDIKDEIHNLYSLINYYKKMENRGLYVNSNSNMNMCFTGNPGTGKTTVARIITGILYETNCIKKNKYVEVAGSDLKASFAGQTAAKTKLILKKAKGGVLFIDEAYSLYSESKEDFGKEAISELLTAMENNRNNPVVIFAGYKQPIEKMISMNEGLRSRIGKYFEFDNYNTKELMQIFMSYIERGSLTIERDALIKVLNIIKNSKENNNFSNARFVRNLYERILKEHSVNVDNDESLNIITLKDVEGVEVDKLN